MSDTLRYLLPVCWRSAVSSPRATPCNPQWISFAGSPFLVFLVHILASPLIRWLEMCDAFSAKSIVLSRPQSPQQPRTRFMVFRTQSLIQFSSLWTELDPLFAPYPTQASSFVIPRRIVFEHIAPNITESSDRVKPTTSVASQLLSSKLDDALEASCRP
jgi:hypothetical protein